MQNGELQTAGFKTSIELARADDHGRVMVAGVKRTQEQRSPYKASPGPSIASIAARKNVGFKRPSLDGSPGEQLEASEIYNVEPLAKTVTIEPGLYTQRVAFRATPGPTQNPLLSLTHPKYGLPEPLLQNFSQLGIRNIYPWQSSCLLGRGLLEGQKNLVYSAPTGGGKSLVADVLLLKRVIEEPGKKAILVLPYVALVQEKLKWFRKIVHGVHKRLPQEGTGPDSFNGASRKRLWSEIRVAGFFGGSKTRSTLSDVDIAICVIEKVRFWIRSDIDIFYS